MTTDPLQAVAQWQHRLDEDRAEFIAAIRAAHEAGYSLRKIADVTNYSHAGIKKLMETS